MNHEKNEMTTESGPFFILGCVRSGTTMLRNILRLHPNLECPEETHFFRWSDPFGSPRYDSIYENNKIIHQQQRMDGISCEEFNDIYSHSHSRQELAENYGRLFLEKKGGYGKRWFDKTPQNVYGILLISHMFPDAKFIHIYRNPLNVAASLFKGKVLSISNMAGVTSYWYETMAIMDEYKKIGSEKVFEIAYEEITSDPQHSIRNVLDFIGEDTGLFQLPEGFVHKERNQYREILSDEQQEEIKRRCSPFFELYGYA